MFLVRLLSAVIITFLQPGSAHATVQLLVQQLNGDVVVTGSGSANTTALNLDGTDTDYANVLTDSQIYSGPDAFADGSGDGGDVGLWGGIISGPIILGSDPGVFENPSSGSGDLFGILANNGSAISQLVLPLGYISNVSLNGTSTFTGITLAKLGFSPGQIRTWTWGTGANADSLRLEVLGSPPSSADVPSPLPIAGAAAAFHSCRRLRRRIGRPDI